ncbi:MAG: virulence-associated E family protein [Bacteroidia bacterium]|nr:virulence-associated E family protein [Bacteroidia bacterium]
MKYLFSQLQTTIPLSLRTPENKLKYIRPLTRAFFKLFNMPNSAKEKKSKSLESDYPKESEKPQNNFTLLRDYMLQTWDFRYNIVRNEIEYKIKAEKDFKFLNDSDVYVHLRENNIYFKEKDFKEILKSSIVESYNPILKYFEKLPAWDLKTDHIEKLISYINYPAAPMDIKVHFKKWIVRTVKCAVDDKYFNKQIFVLIGKQNDGKSTFVRFLVPKQLESYYAENPDFKTKDGEISLMQNFIINMDELANIGKEDTDRLKTYISKVNVNIRRPYASNSKTEPRRASFMGTTNNDEFLTDHTGNVRWLNFKIEGINFSYSQDIDINKVWAQAFHLYKNNFNSDLTKQELNEVETNNEEFKIQTLEMQIIKEYFIKPNEQNAEKIKFMTATDILNYLETINQRYRNLNIHKIGSAMISLGFKKESRRKEKNSPPVKGYWLYLNTETAI